MSKVDGYINGSVWDYTVGRIFHGLGEALLGLWAFCVVLLLIPILLAIKMALMIWK